MNTIAPSSETNYVAAPTQLSVSRSQTAQIALVTAEGDKVTLSSGMNIEAEYSTYGARGTVERSFSFTIEGDLNRRELKDIRKAVRTIEKAARDIDSDKVEKAGRRTSQLEKLESIAQVEAQFSRSFTTIRNTELESTDL